MRLSAVCLSVWSVIVRSEAGAGDCAIEDVSAPYAVTAVEDSRSLFSFDVLSLLLVRRVCRVAMAPAIDPEFVEPRVVALWRIRATAPFPQAHF